MSGGLQTGLQLCNLLIFLTNFFQLKIKSCHITIHYTSIEKQLQVDEKFNKKSDRTLSKVEPTGWQLGTHKMTSLQRFIGTQIEITLFGYGSIIRRKN